MIYFACRWHLIEITECHRPTCWFQFITLSSNLIRPQHSIDFKFEENALLNRTNLTGLANISPVSWKVNRNKTLQRLSRIEANVKIFWRGLLSTETGDGQISQRLSITERPTTRWGPRVVRSSQFLFFQKLGTVGDIRPAPWPVNATTAQPQWIKPRKYFQVNRKVVTANTMFCTVFIVCFCYKHFVS